jgi:[ribosomal protein S5]-alanine N-acetyltransferase
MKIFAETERFILREILPEDDQRLYELDSDSEVHRYLGNKPVKGMEQVRELIQLIRQQYVDNGIGRWAIIDKSTGVFVGWSGLKLMKERTNNHIDYYDLGYRIIRKYWGKGIATETALASIKYAFNVLGITEIYAMADCQNTGSNNVLRKVGLLFIENFDYNGVKHNWYKINREDWSKESIVR